MLKKTLLALALLAVTASAVRAQEAIPREEALKASFALWYSVGKIDDLPLKVDVDIKYPTGVSKGDLGLIVIPETKLADVLAKAGETVQPVGQLWLRGLAPDAVSKSQLKMVEVNIKDTTASVVLCTLGVRKTEKDGLELVIYGKGKEPLKSVPLKAAKGKQEFPIETSVASANETAELTLKLAGLYQANLTIKLLE